jgi:hypothetical protein
VDGSPRCDDFSKENVYDYEYSINIKERKISVIANVTEYDPDSEMSKGTASGGTVSGKPVSSDKDTRLSEKWRSGKEWHDVSWLIARVIRIIGIRLEAVEFKSQIGL